MSSSEAAQACRLNHWKFTPVAVETTGAWGPVAQKSARALARKQAMRSGEALADTARKLWRRLASSVAKGVARMLLRGCGDGLKRAIGDNLDSGE